MPLSDKVDAWSDQRFWDELKRRLPDELSGKLVTGHSLEKSIAPRAATWWSRCSTGGCSGGRCGAYRAADRSKGLNLAASDVNYLWRILREYYHRGRTDLLASYSRFALDRVWKGERFSWFMTRLLHDFPQQSEFDKNAGGRPSLLPRIARRVDHHSRKLCGFAHGASGVGNQQLELSCRTPIPFPF